MRHLAHQVHSGHGALQLRGAAAHNRLQLLGVLGPLVVRRRPAIRHQQQIRLLRLQPLEQCVGKSVGANQHRNAPKLRLHHANVFRPALRVGRRHQLRQHVNLPVLPQQLPRLVHQNRRVVQLVAVPLVQANRNHHAVLARQRRNPVAVLARNRLRQPVRLRILPAQNRRLRKHRNLRVLRCGIHQRVLNAAKVPLAVAVYRQNLANRQPHALRRSSLRHTRRKRAHRRQNHQPRNHTSHHKISCGEL